MTLIYLADEKSYEVLESQAVFGPHQGFTLRLDLKGQLVKRPAVLPNLPDDFLACLPETAQMRWIDVSKTLKEDESFCFKTRIEFPEQPVFSAYLSVTRQADGLLVAIYPIPPHPTPEQEQSEASDTDNLARFLRQQNRAVQALRTLAQKVTSRLSVEGLLETALSEALDLLEVEAGAITLRDEESGALIFKAQQGWQVHDFVEQDVRLRPDAGLTGLVLRTGRPLVLSDVDDDPRIAVPEFREEPVKAMVLAPMRARGRAVGLLSVMSYVPRRFTTNDIALLTAVADQIGVAVDNAHRHEDEKRRRREAERLVEDAQHRTQFIEQLYHPLAAMSEAADLMTLLENFAGIAQRLSGAPIVEVDLYDAAKDHLTLGLGLRVDGSRRPIHNAPHRNSIARAALDQRRLIVQAVPEGSEAFAEGIDYIVAVPMERRNLNGVLMLGYPNRPELDPALRNALSVLAIQGSQALDRLRLLKQEQRQSLHLALINQIGQQVPEILNDERIFAEIVQLIRTKFGLYNVSLYLGDPPILKASSGGRSTKYGITVGKGLAELAMERGIYQMNNHFADSPHQVVPPWIEGFAQAELAVPLVYQGDVVGVLDLFSSEAGFFDEIDIQTLSTLAQHLTIVLENSRLYSDMEQRLSELSTLQEITMALLSTGDVTDVVRIVAQPFLDTLKATAVVVYPVRDDTLVHPGIQIARTDHYLPTEPVLPLCLNVLSQRQPLVAGEIEGLPWPRREQLASLKGGLLAIPLQDAGIAYGILVVYYHTSASFQDEDLYKLGLLRDLAAVALSKTTLYEESLQQVKELSLLYRIALCTRTLTSPKDIAREVSDVLYQTMGWEKVEIYLRDETTTELIPLRLQEDESRAQASESELVAQAAKHRQPAGVLLDESDSELSLQMNAQVTYPMLTGDRLIGVLSVQCGAEQHFHHRDHNLLITVSHLLTSTLDNVNLYQQTRRQLRETTTLYNVTRSIRSSLRLTDVLQHVVNTVHKALQARGSYITLLEGKKAELIVRAYNVPATDPPVETWFQKEQSIVHTVARTGKAKYVPEAQPEMHDEFERGIRSLLAVPLISSKAQVIGVLSVDSRRPKAFSDTDVHLLNAVASQAAIAIENARLYENLKHRNQRLHEAYERLHDLARLKDEILQNVSHELRTPLTFIQGYVELLTEGGMGPLNEEQQSSLEVVARKTADIIGIISAIVALKPLSNERLVLVPISVAETLADVVSLFQKGVRNAEHEVHLHPIDKNLKIHGDLEKVKQLCYNILDNAVKFSPHGGSIQVEAYAEGEYVHLLFTDEGIGIPEDKLDKIFDTFYQVDGSPTRHFGGLGLGLAIVQRIVEVHKGKVWAESRLSHGSTFHVLLPRYIMQD